MGFHSVRKGLFARFAVTRLDKRVMRIEDEYAESSWKGNEEPVFRGGRKDWGPV